MRAKLQRIAGVPGTKVRKIKQRAPHRHTRESGYPEVFDFPGFRVALAIASFRGMTFFFGNQYRRPASVVQGKITEPDVFPSNVS